MIARDKTSLDITWLKDKRLANLDNLPNPDLLAEGIAVNLESVLRSFKEIMTRLKRYIQPEILLIILFVF